MPICRSKRFANCRERRQGQRDRNHLCHLCAGHPVRTSAKLATYSWIGRVARYCHLRALAPAQMGARPSAEHCNRGVPRNRRTQHIDVGCGAHDGAA